MPFSASQSPTRAASSQAPQPPCNGSKDFLGWDWRNSFLSGEDVRHLDLVGAESDFAAYTALLKALLVERVFGQQAERPEVVISLRIEPRSVAAR